MSHADRCDLQLPVQRGVVKSVNHAMNLQDLFRQLFNHPSTLEDLGITEDRSKRNDRVYTSRYVYKLKQSATTGEVYRFKARLIVRGFQMEKGVDFDDSFSPTPGLAVGRFMLSLAVANDYELHACDIEQAFLQADKLPEVVNGRYFIQPPFGSPDANNRNVVYEVCRPLYGNPTSPRALHKTLDAYFMSEVF